MASSALGVLVPLPCACPLQLVHHPPCMHPLLLPPFPHVHRTGGTCAPQFPPTPPLGFCSSPPPLCTDGHANGGHKVGWCTNSILPCFCVPPPVGEPLPLPLVCATPLFTHVPSFFSVFPIFHMEAHGNWGCRSWVRHAHEWERCTHCPLHPLGVEMGEQHQENYLALTRDNFVRLMINYCPLRLSDLT